MHIYIQITRFRSGHRGIRLQRLGGYFARYHSRLERMFSCASTCTHISTCMCIHVFIYTVYIYTYLYIHVCGGGGSWVQDLMILNVLVKIRYFWWMDLIVRGVSWYWFYYTAIWHNTILTIQHWTLGHIGVYISLPHFTLQLFLISGDIAAWKTFNFNQMDGKFIL